MSRTSTAVVVRTCGVAIDLGDRLRTTLRELGALVLALSVVPLVSPAAAQQWTELTTVGPPGARFSHSQVYDPVNNRMIVFGGRDGGCNALNETWILEGANGFGTPTWTLLAPTGLLPPGRHFHSAVYDQATNRMIVFGGEAACFDNEQNDVWVLSNANGLGGTPVWTQLVTTGGPPSPRSEHSAVYNPSSNRMVVFGGNPTVGSDNNRLNDVWVLSYANGLSGVPMWTLAAPTGPAAPTGRGGHTAVFDTGNDRMIVFGGNDGPIRLDALWVLTSASEPLGDPTWIQLSPPDPPVGRTQFSAVYSSTFNRMSIFGGGNAVSRLNDTWVLSDANGPPGSPAWAELGAAGPSPRIGHAATLDEATERMTVFGGDEGGMSPLLNDTWVLIDALGQSPADTTRPETAIDGAVDGGGGVVGEGGFSASAALTVSFRGTDAGGVASFECRVDTSIFAACTSPHALVGLIIGPHTFFVRAIDVAGNVDDTPASLSWSVVTPAQASENLAADVEELVDAGSLNGGQGNALVSKLDGVIKQLAKGKDKTAVNQLRAMGNQVASLVADGVLTPTEGQALTAAITAIIAAIQG